MNAPEYSAAIGQDMQAATITVEQASFLQPRVGQVTIINSWPYLVHSVEQTESGDWRLVAQQLLRCVDGPKEGGALPRYPCESYAIPLDDQPGIYALYRPVPDRYDLIFDHLVEEDELEETEDPDDPADAPQVDPVP
jgi:hypothetical protein